MKRPIITPSYLTIKDYLVFAPITLVVDLNDTFIPFEKFADVNVSNFLKLKDIAYLKKSYFQVFWQQVSCSQITVSNVNFSFLYSCQQRFGHNFQLFRKLERSLFKQSRKKRGQSNAL